ncbi:hypothetical protein SAMN06273572_102634 [Monaibacterium marinum]|uniref:Uncharacterized protein n=1 Tax=Pontivivens marinum TaxID=1690039 RepID=A0A2C9CS22_9RHOB|nr:hypothetical protein [Monaibacterium marinum]SOH93955.1 hypothetical protein SAMN06273572_102634 [Monaibacterium marinum]
MADNYPKIDSVVGDLRICAEAVAKLGDNIEFEKLFILAAIRRTLSLIEAFQHSVEVSNEQILTTILRLNLDTLARFYALFWAEDTDGMDAEIFAKKVFDGERINQMKLRNQNEKATDAWLMKQIKPLGSWIDHVYKNSSGAVHLSDFHMKRVYAQIYDRETVEGVGLKVKMAFGGTEKNSSPDDYRDAVLGFTHICLLLVDAIKDRCGLLDRSAE